MSKTLLQNILQLSLFFGVGILFLLSSCKSKMITTQKVESNKELSYFFRETPHFDTFVAQLQISANGMNAKGDLRIAKNKEIYLSVQAFFIEVARIKITPDSITALDRMHRRYFADSFSNLQQNGGNSLNFNTLQALFTNNIFLPETATISMENINDFNWQQIGDNLQLSPKKSDFVSFKLDKSHTLTQTTFARNNEMQLFWNYSNFKEQGVHQFPYKMEITLKSSKGDFETTLDFVKIELQKSFRSDCSIPSRYSKVELSDILKLLTNL